jgi:hypothetical protein
MTNISCEDSTAILASMEEFKMHRWTNEEVLLNTAYL